MNNKNIFQVLIFLLSSNIYGQTWTNYTTDNSSLPSNKITSITIVDETIWITTDNGIASFDGTNWKSYSNNADIATRVINNSALQKDTSNILWLATDKGVTSFSVEEMEITSQVKNYNKNNSNILSDSVKSVGIDFDYHKWFGTDNGISVLTPNEIINLQRGMLGIKLNSNQINSFSISSDTVSHRNEEYIPNGGVMYIATNGGGVSRFYNHEVDGISSASIVQNKWSGLPSDTVLSVFVDSKNNHWYGTTKGVASHFEHDSKNADWQNYSEQDGLVGNKVTSITSNNNGEMIFGTTDGISLFDGNYWKSYSESDGLISNNVADVEVDSSGNIWIATDNGLSKLSNIPSSVQSKIKKNKDEFLSLTAYPNPFNLNINFTFTVLKSTKINILIYNSVGELVKKIISDWFPKGMHIVNWNAQDKNNKIVNSGVYFVQIQAPNKLITKKIVLLK